MDIDFITRKRYDKEALLKQHSRVFWFTGLSGAGKTTLAEMLDEALQFRGYICQLLDGDIIRTGINNNLGFSEADRMENIRRIAEVSKLFVNCGIITINSFISPTLQMREMAKSIIGPENFVEIYVNASLEVCEKRDVKGLYKKARRGEIPEFTGISSPYEPPLHADLILDTGQESPKDSLTKLFDFVFPQIRI